MTPERLAELRSMPYEAYLGTPEWRRTRDRALSRARWRCESPLCQVGTGLEVHHRNYEHLGEERDEDLRVLCPSHHQGEHARANRFVRLHWRVIRDVINAGPFGCFADFVDSVKTRLATLQIPYDVSLNDILGMALRDVPLDVPTHPTRVTVREDPAHISEQEARDLFEGMLPAVIRTMPRADAISRFYATQREAIIDEERREDFEREDG